MALMEGTFRNLIHLVVTSEIKYSVDARNAETTDSARMSDRYMSAINGTSTKYTYSSYDKEAIEAAGVTDPLLQELYSANPSTIPESLLPSIILQQDIIIKKEYVEYNNYYRKLNGYPDTEDSDVILIDRNIALQYSINPETPIHLMSVTEQIVLDSIGEIDRLKALYPDKKYLNYLGANKIDIYDARIARPFAIIKTDTNIDDDTLVDLFISIYETSREYFTSVLYVKEFESSYDYYDNFIALMISIMTIQRVMSEIFKYSITTDFYDIEIIKLVFEQYRVPFIEAMPVEYQRRLVKSLNQLIRIKSTDKVIYDITSILGFDLITVYKYYIVKEHNRDSEGNPIFVYKLDKYGNEILDLEAMYRFYFQSVDLKEDNFISALTKNRNEIQMEQVTMSDPYWYNDEDLIKFIHEEEFNYMETKYIAFQAMYKMSEMVFDIVHMVSLVIEKKNEYTKTYQIPRLIPEVSYTLFELLVILCALLSAKNKLAGNILYKSDNIAILRGFDLRTDFLSIINGIENDPLLDNRLALLLRDVLLDGGDVDKAFTGIKDFNNLITDIMYNTSDRNTYLACRDLYETLMTREESLDAFKLRNGNPATTFKEYIQNRITTAEILFSDEKTSADYTEDINYILDVFDKEIDDLKNVYYVNESDSTLLNAMIQIVNYFKSYTVDVHNVNILYILDDKRTNTFKFFMQLHQIMKELFIEDKKAITISDSLLILKTCLLIDRLTFVKDTFEITLEIEVKDNLDISDDLSYTATMMIRDLFNLDFSDILKISGSLNLTDKVNMSDSVDIMFSTDIKEIIGLQDTLKWGIEYELTDRLPIVENILALVEQKISDNISMRDKVNYSLVIEPADTMEIFDSLISSVIISLTESLNLNYSDIIRLNKEIGTIQESNKFIDTITINVTT